jgi:ureidoacrylate peracid hydrolase
VAQSLQSLARELNWPIVFTRLEYKPGYPDAGLLVRELAPQIAELGGYLRGSWDSRIVKVLVARGFDLVVRKTRYDAFYRTGLHAWLRNRCVNHLVVAGVLTNVCVESCVRSAFDRDYKVTVISDATASYSKRLHLASLSTLRRHFAEVVTYRQLVTRHRRGSLRSRTAS